ncbi:MAG: hypothetical protein JJT90_15755 [Ectothiorhodospiraceae bacterium]|nr:hypothetical protein [Ectothiorhodospiraceae bacterium]
MAKAGWDMWKQWCGALMVLVAGIMLAACVEDSSSSKSSSSGSSSSGSSSSSCGYTDIVTSSERQQANSCGIQVSSQYAAADAYLEAAIESCKRGYKNEADSYYSNYQKQVEHARKVLEGLCGGSGGSGGGGSFEDPTSAEYYNLCVARLSDTRYMGSCYGPVQYSDTSCPTTQPFNYISRHNSASACWDEWERRYNSAR